MAEVPETKATNVSLVLGPAGIKLDQRGRIRFIKPEILQALLTSFDPEVRAAAEDNYVQCSCNNVQCGKALAETLTDVKT